MDDTHTGKEKPLERNKNGTVYKAGSFSFKGIFRFTVVKMYESFRGCFVRCVFSEW